MAKGKKRRVEGWPLAVTFNMKYSLASPFLLLALAGSVLGGLEDAKFSVSPFSISPDVFSRSC